MSLTKESFLPTPDCSSCNFRMFDFNEFGEKIEFCEYPGFDGASASEHKAVMTLIHQMFCWFGKQCLFYIKEGGAANVSEIEK